MIKLILKASQDIEMSLVQYAPYQGICRLILNNPERRNALSSHMIAELHAAIDRASHDKDCRVVILSAAGHVFSAGHDLAETRRADDESEADWNARIDRLLADCAEMMKAIINAPKPVIAEIGGIATAAGCQLVSVCDLAIAAEEAQFCTPGVNIGIFCTTPLVGIGRNVSRKHAMEMALTGDMFSAADAVRFGLINKAVPAADLAVATQDMATKIAHRSAQGIRAGKQAFYRQLDMDLNAAFAYASQEMRCTITAKGDAEEGVAAFLEKRAPSWGDA
jgi:enoyl-CoA hydratase/carnithine racemase